MATLASSVRSNAAKIMDCSPTQRLPAVRVHSHVLVLPGSQADWFGWNQLRGSASLLHASDRPQALR